MRLIFVCILAGVSTFLFGCDRRVEVIKLPGAHFIKCVGQEKVMANNIKILNEKIIKFNSLPENGEAIIFGGNCIIN